MQAVELIRKKRDGQPLSTAEITWLVEQYTREQIPDYQVSAWLMAVYWRGMNARETSDLTLAMARYRPTGSCLWRCRRQNDGARPGSHGWYR